VVRKRVSERVLLGFDHNRGNRLKSNMAPTHCFDLDLSGKTVSCAKEGNDSRRLS